MAKRKVIIDCDPGVDDVLAILLALASPELEILAFTINFGNTDVDATYNNVIRLYKVLEDHLRLHPDAKSHFPNFNMAHKPILAKGAVGPLDGPQVSAKYFHGRDGLGNLIETHPHYTPAADYTSEYLTLTSQHAASVIVSLINSHEPGEISLAIVGPMTNFALALREDSSIKDRLGLVAVMGGALHVAGNVTPTSEFNWYADPYAVHEILQHEVPKLYVMPLDITTEHVLPFWAYQNIDPSFLDPTNPVPRSPLDTTPNHLTSFTTAFLQRNAKVCASLGRVAFELHDPLIVWFLMMARDGNSIPEGWEYETVDFAVERIGELTRGMCVVDRRPEAKTILSIQAKDSIITLPSQMTKQFSQDSPVVQADAKNGTVESLANAEKGVKVITKTTGTLEMRRLMSERIWRVQV